MEGRLNGREGLCMAGRDCAWQRGRVQGREGVCEEGRVHGREDTWVGCVGEREGAWCMGGRVDAWEGECMGGRMSAWEGG